MVTIHPPYLLVHTVFSLDFDVKHIDAHSIYFYHLGARGRNLRQTIFCVRVPLLRQTGIAFFLGVRSAVASRARDRLRPSERPSFLPSGFLGVYAVPFRPTIRLASCLAQGGAIRPKIIARTDAI